MLLVVVAAHFATGSASCCPQHYLAVGLESVKNASVLAPGTCTCAQVTDRTRLEVGCAAEGARLWTTCTEQLWPEQPWLQQQPHCEGTLLLCLIMFLSCAVLQGGLVAAPVSACVVPVTQASPGCCWV